MRNFFATFFFQGRCYIDYCDSVLYRVTTSNLRPLQSVINAAARLIIGKRKFDHITDTLVDLHWLPVHNASNSSCARWFSG